MFVHTAASPEPAADDEAQALSKAEEILAKERAKPRDIAWAWTVLMDHRQGVALEHNERRFRQILERHRWILALPVLTTDERGCPTRQYGGTPVSGIDRNADPEERLFMRVIDVRGEAIRQGLVWPDEPSAPAGGVVIESCQPAPVEAGLPRQQANHGLSSDAEITVPLDCELFELTETGVEHWLAMDGWSLEESATLLCGANPKRIEEFAKDPNVSRPDYTSCGYMGIADRLRRAAEMGVISFPSPPTEVIRWAAGKQGIPDVLRSSLDNLTSAKDLAVPEKAITSRLNQDVGLGEGDGERKQAAVALIPRSNPLTSVINQARSSALDPEDPSSVWAELVRMAGSPNRPAPLIGYAEDEGIKYQAEKGVQFLTRKNFGDRERRARTRASAR